MPPTTCSPRSSPRSDDESPRRFVVWRRRPLVARVQRSLPLPPDEMAARVRALMMSGGSIARPNEPSTFVTPPELALVHEPKVDGGKLVFFIWQGGMPPSLEEVRVDLTRGAVDRVPASKVVGRP